MIAINRFVSILAVAGLAYSASAAEPKEALESAVKALKAKANYSWSSTTEMANSQFPAMTTKGKTEKDGFTLITSEGPNGETQAVKKGEKGVMKTEDGWQTAEQMQQAAQGQGPGRGFRGRLLTTPLPLEDVEELLKGSKEIKAGEAGVFTAELTEQAAKDRASFFGRRRPAQAGGQNMPEPKDAKGSVKFWVKDGALTKYELKTSSKMSFQGEEREMARTTTTEISAAGSTKVEVPEDAKKKLQ